MDIRDLIQVAGVIDQAEAELLVKCGVRYLGFPLRLPVHSPDLSADEAAAIIRNLIPPTRAVLITFLNQAGGSKRLDDLLREIHGGILGFLLVAKDWCGSRGARFPVVWKHC